MTSFRCLRIYLNDIECWSNLMLHTTITYTDYIQYIPFEIGLAFIISEKRKKTQISPEALTKEKIQRPENERTNYFRTRWQWKINVYFVVFFFWFWKIIQFQYNAYGTWCLRLFRLCIQRRNASTLTIRAYIN